MRDYYKAQYLMQKFQIAYDYYAVEVNNPLDIQELFRVQLLSAYQLVLIAFPDLECIGYA